jgi:mRNA interferase MazF
MCPITSQAKGYPFEVLVQADEIEGVILADHLKSLDWSARRARFIASAPPGVLVEVLERIRPLLGLSAQ